MTAFLLSLMAASLAGCGDDYEHERLGPDSERFRGVSQMLSELRAAGEAGFDGMIDRHGAPNLPPQRRTALAAALRQLIEAEQAELIRMDAFGENVYRATFRLSIDGEERTTAMLLIETDDGLRWAGMN
jgi:hypothetical protein